MTTPTKRRRKFFDCVPGTDGCDETFDIISRTTRCRVAWAGFWEERVQARQAARQLTIALNRAFVGRRLEFDIAGLAEEQRQIAVVYGIEQLQWNRRDLNDEQAWSVLKHCDTLLNDQMATMIKSVAEELFPALTREGGNDYPESKGRALS